MRARACDESAAAKVAVDSEEETEVGDDVNERERERARAPHNGDTHIAIIMAIDRIVVQRESLLHFARSPRARPLDTRIADCGEGAQSNHNT